MALVSLAAFCEGQGPATLKALDAIASFIGDWKSPKGTLVIDLEPAKTAALSDIDKIMEPNALIDIFGLSDQLSGHPRGSGESRPGRQMKRRLLLGSLPLLSVARPGLAQDSFPDPAHPDDRAVPAGRRGGHHRPADRAW